jgi:hypothetical protein
MPYVRGDVKALASDQRSRLLHTNERLDDHSDRLARVRFLSLTEL